MRRGLCVKCGTPTVYRKFNGISSRGSDENSSVYVHTGWPTWTSPVEHLICTSCGYFESYVIDEEKMSEITKTREKVG